MIRATLSKTRTDQAGESAQRAFPLLFQLGINRMTRFAHLREGTSAGYRGARLFRFRLRAAFTAAVFVAACAFFGLVPLRAETPPSSGRSLQPVLPTKNTSDTATRSRWVLGAQVGFSMEYGSNQHEVSHIALIIAQPQLGLIVSNFQTSPIRRFEVISEGILGEAAHPHPSRLLGNTLIFRLDGKEYGRWVPFFDAGLGAQYTTLNRHVTEIDGPVQFSPQGGFGVEYFVAPQRALVLEWRTTHMSNASLVPPNMGFNSSMITVGFRWFRKPI